MRNKESHSDRLIFVKTSATPVDIVIVQVYMRTVDHDDEGIEKVYDEISDILGLHQQISNEPIV